MEQLMNCQGLTKRFGYKTALDGVNLTLERGRIIGLLGPNGSGKTTLIKLLNGLLAPTSGTISINGSAPGPETKKIVSYLPERTYFNSWMKVTDILNFFCDFYEDFDRNRASDMLRRLGIDETERLGSMSKGTKEKVQLIMVMSQTIITNYNENASVLISTHLIADIENVLDDVIFIENGHIRLHASVDEIREQEGKSVDALFREVFRC